MRPCLAGELTLNTKIETRRRLLAGSAATAFAAATLASPAAAVVPNETTDSEAIVDTENVYAGVGVIVTSDPNEETIGICTGSLINPRTVLFAAHCVNDRAATDYNDNQVRSVVSFNFDAFEGLVSWFSSGGVTNTALASYNINRIFYDRRSLQNPQAGGFIEADIALASLDTPAVGIPTWALLFSTLPAPEAIDPVRGTGYQVDIVGYGRTGTAFDGAIDDIDFRRRAAENMLGGFLSNDDLDGAIFGPGEPNLPQNLYFLDFDSQDRSVFSDLNLLRDDALPNEGDTAGGDSGGPLILGAANNTLSDEDLIIGVLSGGGNLFGPPSSLGGISFYQPLSLYWQYIAETNPYRYVGAKAGNGDWEDPEHWVSLLDPMYRVIDSNGAVVNGLPTTPELGLNGTEGDYGSVCVEFEDELDGCTDVATGEFESTAPPEPSPTGAQGIASALHDNRGTATFPLNIAARDTTGEPSAEAARGEVETSDAPTLPEPTLANGLPGATGFVPNNIDPIVSADLEENVDPRYFDVTLRENGTTTLSSEVTIDRLTVRGNAGLTVAAAGDLVSLIDINQFGGRVNVNGGLTSVGDYTLFAGMLEGTGTVIAPFVTSITGVISPGTMGTTGTLTIDGNLIMASGSTFLVDLGPNGASDRLAVTGVADVGGVVSVGTGVTQTVNGRGQRYTIVTAGDGVSGTFTERELSAILTQEFIYEENAVLMEITAASYETVIDEDNPVQGAYAQLFDQNRPNAALASLYGLDFADVDTIRNTFSNLAPVNEQAVRSMSAQTVNLLQNFYDTRLRDADKSQAGGKIAVTGAPLSIAAAGLSPVGQPIGAAALGMQSGTEETEMVEANLPENLAIFVAGGLVSGDSDSLPGYNAGEEVAGNFIARETEIDGFYLAAGLEFYPGEATMVGVSGYYSSLDADVPLGQQVESDTYAATLYVRHKLEAGPVVDGQLTIGSMGFDTTRTVQFLNGTQTLTSSSEDLLVSGVLGLSYDIDLGGATLSPGVEGRYASVDLASIEETGGTLGLAVERNRFESKQARAGFDFETQAKVVQINATAQYVHEFEDGPQLLAANFAQGVGPNANFVLEQADSNWVEVGLSAQIGRGPVQFGIGFDTTLGRNSAEARAFRASATYRF
jgi:uncharacterized protein YhjY with autotransporter beta-barrel domain